MSYWTDVRFWIGWHLIRIGERFAYGQKASR